MQSSQRVSNEAFKSLSLKSYNLLNPRGPNFFLSKITPCKNTAPNINLLKFTTFNLTLLSKYSSSNFIKDPIIFFFKPFGGSYATFVPFCKIWTGNFLHGIEVRNNLKSLLTLVLGSLSLSHCANNCTNQSSNKWQLHRITQFPSDAPRCIACTALSSDPDPKDNSLIYCDLSEEFLAMSFIESEGSAPFESIKIIGVLSSESSRIEFSLIGGGFA